MDGERFDDLIRQFCTTRLTRISALRGLVAGAAAALTGATLASDETDAKKKGRHKGGKGREKSAKGKSGGKKGKSSGRRGQKGKQPRTNQRLQTEAVIPFGCDPGKVALCHNSTANNGGVIQCPSASSADLAGHCGHNDEDANPFDCYCPNGGFVPGVNCAGFDPQLQECGSCNKDGTKCHFVCDPDDCPPPSDDCHEAVCIDNACAEQEKADGAACGDGGNDICCNGVCTDNNTITDCGTCGNACTAPECQDPVCTNGVCGTTNEPDNTACGDGGGDICCSGSCISNDTTDNCGTCGNECSTDNECLVAVCRDDGTCGTRRKDNNTPCNDGDDICCDGVCVSNDTTDNCGTCGNACTAPECQDPVCTNGICGTTNEPQNTPCGEDDEDICCDGVCISNDTTDNCGTCGNACSAPECQDPVCTNGVCGAVNEADNTPCGEDGEDVCCNGVCTDDDTDDNCGACGNVCSTDNECLVAFCRDETCVTRPKDDNTACGPNGDDVCCDGVCTDADTITDCGACGNVCTAPECQDPVCNAGTCGTVDEADNTACGPDGGDICCDGSCVSNDTTSNCGTCGAVCTAPECQDPVCTNGVCGTTNEPQNTPCGDGGGDICCDGSCISNDTTSNCGTCGNKCPNCRNTICTPAGACACTPTPRDVACAGKCGQTVDNGCCGTYQCDACCKSCTIGYYSSNNVCNGLTVNGTKLNDLTFPCLKGTKLGDYCFKYDAKKNGGNGNGTLTIGEALKARGGDVVCAQAAAAFLNKQAIGAASCAAGLNFATQVCNATDLAKLNQTLTSINEGFNNETCPFKGCKK